MDSRRRFGLPAGLWRLGRASRRSKNPKTERGEDRYRSPQEIALQNAADSLGVTLGEYYPEDIDSTEGLPPWADKPADQERLDASREELLAYIEGLERKRRRRRQSRQIRIAGAFAAVAAIVTLALNAALREPSSDGPSGHGRGLVPDAWSKLSPPRRSGMGVRSLGTSVETEMPSGRGQFVNTTFQDIRGGICTTTTFVIKGVTESGGGGGCISPSQVGSYLARESAFVISTMQDVEFVLLQGYGRANLKEIVVRSGKHRIDVTISSPWRPDEPDDSVSFKAFLVRVWYGGTVNASNAMRLANASLPFDLMTVSQDGRVAPVTGIQDVARGGSHRRLIDPVS